MKRKKLLCATTVVLCIVALASCVKQQSVPKTTESQTSESDAVTSDESKHDNSIQDGMQQISFSIDTAVQDFDLSKETSIEMFNLNIDIPNYMTKEEDIDNCKTYLRYDEDAVDYLRGFVLGTTLQVDSTFVIDDSIHDKTATGGTWKPLADYKVSEGTTKSGYKYVLYEKTDEKSFLAYVYVRIADEYIASFQYWDRSINYHYLSDSISSINISK